MKVFQVISLFALIFIANGFHYTVNGADWSEAEWQCLISSSQSPINIDNSSLSVSSDYDLIFTAASAASGIKIVNNGHSIQADHHWISFQAVNIQEQEKQYEAVQLHFHSPSEHTFDGNLSSLEIHIVCDQVEGADNGFTKGVLALIFQVNETYGDNALVEPFAAAAAIFASSSSKDVKDVEIDPNFYDNLQKTLSAFGENQLQYYTYQGSLTTPPCTQIVEWYVIKQSLPISTKQLKSFQDLWENNAEFAEGKGNNRVVQNLNGRIIKQGTVDHELEKVQEVFGDKIQYSLLAFLLISIMIIF